MPKARDALIVALAALLAPGIDAAPLQAPSIARIAQAAAAGDTSAARTQAQLVAWGQVHGNREDARAALARAALGGDAAAAFTLGSLYDAGVGVAANLEQALHWWQTAADAGHDDAAFNVGLLMLRNATDTPTALIYLRRAAANRHALACYVLGTWLAENRTDDAATMGLLTCAASQGYAPAQFNLGKRFLAIGEHDAARHWLAQAATTFAPAKTALSAIAVTPAPLSRVAPTVPAPTVAVDLPAAGVTAAIHDLAWVIAQPPDHYTVVVSAAAQADALEQLLRRHAGTSDSAYFLHRPGARQPYTAIVGSFASQGDAAQALSALAPVFLRNQPWIRRFESLQDELAAVTSARPAKGP